MASGKGSRNNGIRDKYKKAVTEQLDTWKAEGISSMTPDGGSRGLFRELGLGCLQYPTARRVVRSLQWSDKVIDIHLTEAGKLEMTW